MLNFIEDKKEYFISSAHNVAVIKSLQKESGKQNHMFSNMLQTYISKVYIPGCSVPYYLPEIYSRLLCSLLSTRNIHISKKKIKILKCYKLTQNTRNKPKNYFCVFLS